MPFSYSIAYGLIAGLLTYTTLNGLTYIIKLVSFGRIVPADEDSKEYWSYKLRDGDVPWFMRVAQGHRRFWDAESLHKSAYDSPDRDSGSLVHRREKEPQDDVIELRRASN